jgi:hypothetical protein
MSQVIEAQYPIRFRSADSQTLGQHLLHHNSVSCIGMKRVGISNFLRFFLNHSEITPSYLNNKRHVFVVIDLNNLVEKTLYAFWMLTLKRIVDAIEAGDFSYKVKEQSRSTFTQSIQLSDPFFTVESVRKLITFFFLRFDRLQDVVTPEFLANIQGLKDSDNHLSYVFTSARPLHEMSPNVFTRSALSGFSVEMYIKPAKSEDLTTILSTFQERYGLTLSTKAMNLFLKLAGGHAHYLHLILIKIKNEQIDVQKLSDLEIEKLLAQDEEIRLLSEELFSSFTQAEQDVLLNLGNHPLTADELTTGKYLWDTGVLDSVKNPTVFSPLFDVFLQEIKRSQRNKTHDFTKKEHDLFEVLLAHSGELVERETIIEAVWPDEMEIGVSDWSIDRLVSRVRTKLKNQNSEYKIVTVITRGYKLVKKN